MQLAHVQTSRIQHGLEPLAVEFTPGTLSDDETQGRMAELIFETSYLEYCSYGNILGLPFVELQRKQNIEPYLSQIQVMQRGMEQPLAAGGDRFLGFFTAATWAEFSAMPSVSYYRDSMKTMDAAYDDFIGENIRPSDYFVASLAIDARCRGQGLFNPMWAQIQASARAAGSTRIVLAVWESSASCAMYLRKGLRPVAKFDHAYPVFFDHLVFMVFPLND